MSAQRTRLNMAELEQSALQRRCLRQRLPDRTAMARETAVWAARRNDQTRRTAWQSATAAARTELRRLYPGLEA